MVRKEEKHPLYTTSNITTPISPLPTSVGSVYALHGIQWYMLGLAPALPRLKLKIGLGPAALERDARVPARQAGGGDDDHSALEHHEGGFVLGQLALEALAQPSDSVAGAPTGQPA